MAESGQRNLEAGNFCPDIARLNFLPFAPHQDLQTLPNISGGTGPIAFPSVGANINSISGVLGAGTFYPGSGSLEALSRLFWCVRSWSLQVQVNANLAPISTNIVDPLTYFLAAVNVPNTNFGSINQTTTKVLSLGDVYATGNNITPPLTPLKTANTAIPIDPIMRWDELMCRSKYFSWSPPNELVTGFWQARVATPYLNQPYAMQYTVNLSQALPDGTLSPPCYGLWMLSVMNSDRYVRSSQILSPTGAGSLFTPFTPTGHDSVDQNGYFLAPRVTRNSGVMTNRSGEVTGYGYLPRVSGEFPLLMYRETCEGHNSGCASGVFEPQPPNNYFPHIDFQMWFKTFSNQAGAPQFATIVSTVKQSPHWVSAGLLRIIDSNLSGLPNSTATGKAAKALFTCPLFTPATTRSQALVVELLPASFWLTSSGTINY